MSIDLLLAILIIAATIVAMLILAEVMNWLTFENRR